MRRAVLAILVAALSVPAAGAQSPHVHPDDFVFDDRVLGLVAAEAMIAVAEALNLSLVPSPSADAAFGQIATAGGLADHLVASGAVGAPATSGPRARELGFATAALASGSRGVVRGWQLFAELNSTELTTPEGRTSVRHSIRVLVGEIDVLTTAAGRAEAVGLEPRWIVERLAIARAHLVDVDAALAAIDPVAAAGPVLLLHASPGVVRAGTTLTLHGIVFRDEAGVDGAAVSIRFDGETIADTVSEPDGQFQVAYAVPRDTAPGLYTATATATKDALVFPPAERRVRVVQAEGRLPTTTSVVLARGSADVGEVVGGTVRLAERGGDPILGAVEIQLPNGSLVVHATNAEGLASFSFVAEAAGEATAAAAFPGDDVYEPSSGSAHVTIRAPARETGEDEPLAFRSGAIAAFAVALQTASLVALRGRRGFGAAVVLSPVLVAAVVGLAASPAYAVAAFLASGVSGLVLWATRRDAAGDAVSREAPAGPEEAVARELERLEVRAEGPLRDVLLAYRAILLALVDRGVSVGPQTPREIALELVHGGHAPDAVRAVTDVVERALYGARLPEGAELESFRTAARTIGGSS